MMKPLVSDDLIRVAYFLKEDIMCYHFDAPNANITEDCIEFTVRNEVVGFVEKSNGHIYRTYYSPRNCLSHPDIS